MPEAVRGKSFCMVDVITPDASAPELEQALSLITSPFQEVTPELVSTLQEYGKPPLFQLVIRHLRSGEHALRTLQEALSPWRVGQKTPTGLSAWNTLEDCYTPDDLARLREIKRRVDPHGTFVGNFRLL
ncbi:hypothetical protein [Kribbella sp.]|uniref:hypothetical protein n=1 Tax=Kribbella sp. TaxID=1871183 RepID=UPI002D594069|nr:hypothetical protein [Kribbella sp.]HZX06929.1 hypothetical protein [Kribbella sp.]